MTDSDHLTSTVLQRLLGNADSRADSIPLWREAYRDAAAVLASFEPTKLKPMGLDVVPDAWHQLLADCEPVDVPFGPGRWRLRDSVRRVSLRRLHVRGQLAESLASNPDRLSRDPLQKAIESIIAGKIPPLPLMQREEIAAYGVAREWFDGIVEVPSEAQLRGALPVAEMLGPLQRLADGFVGRDSELVYLEDYVGALDARTVFSVLRRGAQKVAGSVSGWVPLFVYGPGGVGKSTLIAKFVLDHFNVASELRLPFAYLDIDRAEIDPQRPLTLLLETMKQLRLQFEEQARMLDRLIDDLRNHLSRVDRHEISKGPRASDLILPAFVHWAMTALRKTTRQPIVLVVDTFEEVQFLGPTAVEGVWRLLEDLQSKISNVRVIVAGRVLPDDLQTRSLELTELDAAGARALLRKRLDTDSVRDVEASIELPDSRLDEIIGTVGRTPMALRLAAQIVDQQGIDKLRSIETRNFFFLTLRTEKIQAQLYGRILAHIHDPKVRKLAYPGLVVRRVTPEVILEVLAGPCGVEVSSPQAAEELFLALEQEIALFQPDLASSEAAAQADDAKPFGPHLRPLAVRHRLDVRRMMLQDLLQRVPAKTVRRIDEGAVAYYARQQGPRARAEEIYHRLRLGQPLLEVEARWDQAAADYLRAAPEELPPRARLWLMMRLGATPPEELLTLASLETWEESVARDVQRCLESDNPWLALKLLGGRDERTPTSPLVRLEAEAHRLIGDNGAARDCALAGIESAAAAGDATIALDLNLFVAELDEGDSQLDDAMARLEDVRPLLANVGGVDTLRLHTARIRVRRLLGEEFDGEREELVELVLTLLTPELLNEIRDRPALLREMVAEIGSRHFDLLREGLDIVGLELDDDASRSRLLTALVDWGALSGEDNRITQAISAASVFEQESNAVDLPAFAEALGGSTGIAQLLSESTTPELSTEVTEALADVYRAAVLTSIKGKPDLAA